MLNQIDNEVSDFSRILHNEIVGNPKAPSIEQIADLMGCSPIQIYKILAGERALRVEDLPRIYRFAGKPLPALEYLVRKCDPMLEIVKIDVDKTNGSIEDELQQIVVKLGKLTDENIKAKQGGRYSKAEVGKIRKSAVGILKEAKQMIIELNRLEKEA